MRALALVILATPCLAATLDAHRLERLLGFSGRPGADPARAVAATAPLPFRLLGTLRASTPERSLAAVEWAKKTLTLRVGDVLEGIELVAIEQQELVVLRDGRLERVGAGPIVAPSPGPRAPTQPQVLTGPGGLKTVNRRDVEAVISNPLTMMNDVRLVPAMEGGRMIGFRAPFVREGSPVSLLGLQPGDVIRSVNGQPLDNLERLMGLFQALQSTSRFEIGLERSGQRVTQPVELR